MPRALLITVRFHDGRYHGMRDGPPSPARLFQALLAGAGLGGGLDLERTEALKWLEDREPPVIGAPAMVRGQSVTNYVPNNDLDAVGGDLRRISKIRTSKTVRPLLFEPDSSWLYAWTFQRDPKNERQAQVVCGLAERLYQLGRGVDMAWAWGEVLDHQVLAEKILNYPGLVYRPSRGGGGTILPCPQRGSLASLKLRYAANSSRVTTERRGRTIRQLFTQPPKPRFMQVSYESPPSRRVYELRECTSEAAFGVWPLARASVSRIATGPMAARRSY